MDLEELVAGRVRAKGVRSRRGSWYGNDDRLVATSAHGHGDQATDLLAQGLQYLEGRDLHLVVPRSAIDVLRARAAFLDATVYVHPTRRTGFGEPEPPMTRSEATAFYRRLGGVIPSPRWEATGWPGWLVELVDWLESRRVERVRTTEAQAWHYRGRQVLLPDHRRTHHQRRADRPTADADRGHRRTHAGRDRAGEAHRGPGHRATPHRRGRRPP